MIAPLIGGLAAGWVLSWLFRRWRNRPGAPAAPPAPAPTSARAPEPSSGRRAPVVSVSPNELRHAAEQAWVTAARARDRKLVVATLAEIREGARGEEAIFWRWLEHRDSLAPDAWCDATRLRPAHFDLQRWAALVQWSAQERVVQLDGDEGRPTMAAAPVLAGDRLLGVLSVSRATGLPPRDQLRVTMPRFADQLARVIYLTETRLESQRQLRQARALLAAVQQIQSQPTGDALCRAICQTALEVSTTSAAALVRWDAANQVGTVQVAIGFDSPPESPVDAESAVAGACRNIATETRISPAAQLFAPKAAGRLAGAAAVIPIAREYTVLGAIVVWSADDHPIAGDEIDNIRLLGAAATTALEGVWRIEEVEIRARTDPLTGLANRRHLEERLATALGETDRFGAPTSLILVDIDHFKHVNDTWGHEAGDHVLQRVARLLSDAVRTVDTCARYGGEEIALLLPQTALTGAVDLAERLRRTLSERPVYYHGTEIPVTASFGVSSYPESAGTHDALVTTADRALYEAKSAGRNRVKSATPRQRSARS